MSETNNAINLLVSLGVDTITSKANLDTQIEKLSKQLKGLDIRVDIDRDAIQALNELSRIDLKGLSDSIKGAGKGLSGIGNESKQASNEVKRNFSDVQKSLETNFNHLSKDFQQAMSKGVTEVDQLKAAFKGMEASFKMDYEVIGQSEAGEQIKRVKAIEASYKNLQGQIEKVKFNNNSAIDMGNGDLQNLWLPDNTSKVIDSEMKKVEVSISNAVKKTQEELHKLVRTGEITEKQFYELSKASSNIMHPNSISLYNQRLTETLSSNKNIKAELQKQVALKEQIHKLENNIITAQKRDPKGLGNKSELSQMLTDLNKIDPASKGAIASVDNISKGFTRLKAESTLAGRESLSMVDSLKIALEKFPIWMVASTAFYGTVRSAREFGSIIVDIDTKMTALKKVMDSGTDFEALFDRATQSAERFGKSISETMDSYIEFAKQGYTDSELGFLSDAAVVASNVGDITAHAASEFMTASLVQWKKDAKDAMSVIDSWNEVSNNYATTVERLAQGQARAGATARAMGMDFDQLNAVIGTVTASTKQSGNEVGNFVKAVLPRLVGAPAQKALDSLDISLTDKEGNLRDVIQVYTEVAEKVKGIADSERIAVVEGLAGKFHISRMQALLDDLGSADSMYRSMYETSVNSAGSAIQENEQYMKSLEARMALARVEVEKLALAIGDAFLTEGMVQGIKVFSDSLIVITKLADSVGALPIVFALVGASAFGLSSRFRTLVTALTMGTVNMNATKAASVGMATGMTSASVATRTLSTSIKGLLAASGVGLVLAGIGTALEFIIGKMGEARRKSEELASFNKLLAESYEQNKETIDGLAKSYRELSEKDSLGALVEGSKEHEKYLSIQNELASLLPELVIGEDAKGNSILANNDIVSGHIELLRERLEIERALKREEQISDSKDRFATAKNEAKDAQDTLEGVMDNIDSAIRSVNQRYSSQLIFSDAFGIKPEDIKGYDDVVNKLTEINSKKKEIASTDENFANSPEYQYYDTLSNALSNYADSYNKAYRDQSLGNKALQAETRQLVSTYVSGNEDMSTASKNFSIEILNAGIAGESSAKKLEHFQNIAENLRLDKGIDSDIKLVEEAFDKLTSSTGEDFDQLKLKFEDTFKTMKSNVLEQSNLDVGSDKYEVLSTALDKARDSKLGLFDAAVTYSKQNNISLQDAILQLKYVEDQEEAESALTSTRYELVDITEQLSGVSKNLIDDNEELIFQHEMLTSQLSLLTEGTKEYEVVKRELETTNLKLLDLNPRLHADGVTALNLGADQIKMIRDEVAANDILMAAIKASRDGKLTSEQNKTLASLQNTKARINNVAQEISALNKLKMKYDEFSAATKAASEVAKSIGAPKAVQVALEAASMSRAVITANQTRTSLMSELNGLMGEQKTLSSELASIDEVVNNTSSKANQGLRDKIKAAEKAAKAQKESNKTTKDSIYITDEYKLAVEALNYELAKLQKIKDDYPKHSKQHQDALKKEIELQKQLESLTNKQADALEAQIKSGKIKKTGTISSTSKSLSGWSGSVSSQYGMRKHPIYGDMRMHDGIDIGGKLGTRLDSNVSGKVLFAGSKGNGLGNHVIIETEDGLKHIYAHLDKVVAKLGDSIVEGIQIGTIGKSGAATGSHLHYQVNDKSGKSINPTTYLQDAKSSKTSSISTVDNSQQAIDDAISQLNTLRTNALKYAETIEKLEFDLIDTYFSAFERKRVESQQIIEYELAKLADVDTASNRYGATLDKVSRQLNSKQRANREELTALEELIRKGGLTGNALEAMKDRVWELKTEMFNLNSEIQSVDLDRLNLVMGKHDEIINDIVFSYTKAESIMSLYEEGTADYNQQLSISIELQKQHRDAVKAKLEALQQEILMGNLSAEAIKANKKEIQDLTIEYWNLSGAVISAEKSLEASRKKMAEEAADAYINAYKSYISEKRDMTMRSYDELDRAEDKRHKQVMDNYKKESEAFRKIIQEKLDAIDKEESERSYGKEIDKLEEERLKVLNKLNLLSLDDSLEAKAERKKLSEDLSKIEEDLFEKRNAKEVTDRKDNLNNMLKDKEEQIKKEEELADEQHETAKDRIDKEKRYWDQFYNDQLNDERKFAQMKEDIVAGNFDKMSAEFQDYIKEMEDTMPDLVDTLDGSMQAVGTSIRQNLIDNLREALNMLAQVDANNIATANPTPGGQGSLGTGAGGSLGSSSSQSKSTLNSGDLNVLTGKFLNDRLASQESNPVRKAKIKEKAYELASSGRSSGSSISSSEGFDSIIAGLSQADKALLGQHLQGSGSQHVSTPELQDFIKKYGQSLMNSSMKLNTGGYVKKGAEGLAMLHEEEVTLNKKETKDFFKYAPILEKLNALLSPLTMPKVKAPDLAGVGGDTYYFDFHVDKMTGSEQDANNFMKNINDRLKRNKGMR